MHTHRNSYHTQLHNSQLYIVSSYQSKTCCSLNTILYLWSRLPIFQSLYMEFYFQLVLLPHSQQYFMKLLMLGLNYSFHISLCICVYKTWILLISIILCFVASPYKLFMNVLFPLLVWNLFWMTTKEYMLKWIIKFYIVTQYHFLISS